MILDNENYNNYWCDYINAVILFEISKKWYSRRIDDENTVVVHRENK